MTVTLYPSVVSMYRRTEYNIVKIETEEPNWVLTHLYGKIIKLSRDEYPEIRVA